MSPLTIALLAAGGLSLLTLLWYLLRHKLQDEDTRQLPPHEADPPPDEPNQSARQAQPPPPPPPCRPTEAEIISEIASHVAFSRRRVVVGHKTVGRRVVGHIAEESPYPADDIMIRPIGDLGEIPQMLPSERISDHTTQVVRSVTGQALVMANIERRPVTEPIIEPIFREGKQVLYLLLDVSGSMVGQQYGGDWKMPLWRGVSIFLIRRAQKEHAAFLLRTFADDVSELEMAETEAAAKRVENLIRQQGDRGGTNIGLALRTAIADIRREAYDQAELMILTDGEDDKFDASSVRQELDAANIKLHAVLLGTQNEALRRCADVYQEVLKGGEVKPPVSRRN